MSDKKWTIGWGVTSRCDLSCQFCYSQKNRSTSIRADIDLEIASAFLINNSRYITSINFGTGESFLFPSFPQLLEKCNKYLDNCLIAVTTNGAIIDFVSNKELLMVFSKTIDELDVSLDFANPQKHDLYRGKKGAWNRALSALELGRKLGMTLSIVMVATPKTIFSSNLIQMLSIAEHYEASLRINIYMPTTGDFSFSVTYAQILEMLYILQQYSTMIQTSDPLFSAIIYNCNASKIHREYNSFRLLPNSKISPSTYLIESPWAQIVDLKDLQLDQIDTLDNIKKWKNPILPSECIACELCKLCKGGSRERRILWFGTLEERDPYCPLRHNETISRVCSSLSRPNDSSHLEWGGPTVHLDYLPTIVSQPKKEMVKKNHSCVKAILVSEDLKVLLLKKRNDDSWDLPGGQIENETPLECIKRELFEELGYILSMYHSDSCRWISFEDNNLLFGETYIYRNVPPFKVIISEEHSDYIWIDIENLSKYLRDSISQSNLELYKRCVESALSMGPANE